MSPSSRGARLRTRRRASLHVRIGALAILAGMFAAHSGSAEEARREPTFDIHGYGTAAYFHFDWDTDPDRRDRMDLERFALYPSVRLSPKFDVRGEIEFEHGGTGSTMEFDRFEEFGEYEMEIDKGGEVQLEQLYLAYRFSSRATLALGRVKVPFALASVHDEPSEYHSPLRSEMESSLIPVNWYEDGVQFRWRPGARFSTVTSVVNGLDATGFSSASWVARGHQGRFETVAAEDLALAIRADWEPGEGNAVGVSAYRGNSANNRPKPDLDVDAHVTIVDAHAEGALSPVAGQAVFIYGHLEHSDAVSRANRNLSNNLGVKRTPVGSAALGYSIEVSLDLAPLLLPERAGSVVLYVRHDFYDSMYRVTGDVFDNPRWERKTDALGANWSPEESVVFKAEYSRRRLGIPVDNLERTFILGLGFEF